MKKFLTQAAAVGGVVAGTASTVLAQTTPTVNELGVDVDALITDAGTKLGAVLIVALPVAFGVVLAWRAFRAAKRALSQS